MTAIAGRRMAETVARRGGVAVLPQDIPLDIVGQVIAYVKSRHPVYETPITLGAARAPSQEALSLIHKRAHGAVIVVDDDERAARHLHRGDAAGFDRFTQLHQVMSQRPASCIDAGTPLPDVFERLIRPRVSAAPVVRRRPAGRRHHPQGRAALDALPRRRSTPTAA